ncbi:hypothetical protein QBC47DRAFT_393958 [Echria macrotheca]|uniref:Zn(2)-C6 fungal-type domain-containing protein n=1 Tax=Echria macrotheca TaxID=438768 RepID=A0AAJ0B2A0_9PEZI|nr:hypothetical protein QBC47DRAFT_393958 [Echria macrotheca]
MVPAGFAVFSLDGDKKPRAYSRRKRHTKTKLGCLTCRAKRVKCDEARPQCARCLRNTRVCVYSGNAISSKLSVLDSVTVIPFPANEQLLAHLHGYWVDVLGLPRTDLVLSMFQASPLVRHAMLALAASHLRHVSPLSTQHRVMEHVQIATALSEYQHHLNIPPADLGRRGADALLTAGVLLSMLAFTLPACETGTGNGEEESPYSSWVFSHRPDRLGWFSLQSGLRHLLVHRATHLDETLRFLTQVFLGVEVDRASFSGAAERGEFIVPELWTRFFGLDHDGGEDNVYRVMVGVLLQLKGHLAAGSNVLNAFQFVAKVQGRFCALVYERDPRAMWMLGYWLGIMWAYPAWWCTQRVRRDYRAILMWLEVSRPEGRDWDDMLGELRSVVDEKPPAHA